jgi:hypothetical protein
MIHQHQHPRHHYPYTHYIPYIILAIAVVALVFLLVNMIITGTPSEQVNPANQPRTSQQSMNVVDRHTYNLIAQYVPNLLPTVQVIQDER